MADEARRRQEAIDEFFASAERSGNAALIQGGGQVEGQRGFVSPGLPVPPEVLIGGAADAAALARGAALGVGGVIAAGAVILASKIFEEKQNQEIDELIRGQDNAIEARLAKKRIEKTLRTQRLRTPELIVSATRAESNAAKIQSMLPTDFTRGSITFEREQRTLARGRALEPAVATGGDLAAPPSGRDPALSEEDRFPFRDPFEEPLGDDPLPPTKPPGFPLLPVPVELPVEIPAPEPLPKPQTKPAPAPAPSPTPTPRRAPVPRAPIRRRIPTIPILRPFSRPALKPRRVIRPVPLTPVGPGSVDLPDIVTDPPTLSQPSDFPQPLQSGRCPPCPKTKKKKKKKKKPRTECFKGLYRESRFDREDTAFQLIDCETGKEINEPTGNPVGRPKK